MKRDEIKAGALLSYLNLLIGNAFLLIVAVGMTFVILTGGIDLSVGAVVAFSTVLLASLVQHHGWHPLAAIALVLALGTAFGAAMGVMIQRYRLPPFVVTLAGMFLARGAATLVSVEHLGESSRLGRMFSEQIASRVVQRGVPVAEVRLREQLALQPGQGELLLSRELREVSQNHDAQAVVVGTYAVSGAMVYVSLKLVSPQGNQVVAATDYALPVDDNLRGLLRGR